MSQSSLILELPYIQPAQAQKHVTHNEALRVLDAIVQLSVASASVSAPPISPEEGTRYLVSTGATGDWVDQDGLIAVFDTGVWGFIAPQEGWQAYVQDIAAPMFFDGTSWLIAIPAITELHNISALGVNTTADGTNPLAVSGAATLLNHAGSGHQLKVNKATETDTASLLFQTGWSGRAEMGAAGTDDFEIKVSGDGAAWNTGAVFDRDTGLAQFPSGAQISNRVEVGGRFYCYTDNRWITYNSSYGAQSENNNTNCGTSSAPWLSWTQMGLFVPKGAVLTSMDGFMRSSSGEITDVEMRAYFQTGTFGTTWADNADTTRTWITTETVATPDLGFKRATLDLEGTIAPEDGFLMFYVRPTGTLTATRYLYASMALRYLTAD